MKLRRNLVTALRLRKFHFQRLSMDSYTGITLSISLQLSKVIRGRYQMSELGYDLQERANMV